jgi:hypothetical protein
VLTTGWLARTRRLGRLVIWAALAWGTAVAPTRPTMSLWSAALLFVLAGAADSVSAVCRDTIDQLTTLDRMRGGMFLVAIEDVHLANIRPETTGV